MLTIAIGGEAKKGLVVTHGLRSQHCGALSVDRLRTLCWLRKEDDTEICYNARGRTPTRKGSLYREVRYGLIVIPMALEVERFRV